MSEQFSGMMRLYLAKLWAQDSTEKQICSELGIHVSTPRKWRAANPDFKLACARAKEQRIADQITAIDESRKEALSVIAAIGAPAARRLAEYIDIPLEKLTDRGKATQVRTIQYALDVIGVRKQPPAPSGKIDILAVLMEISREKDNPPQIEGTFREIEGGEKK